MLSYLYGCDKNIIFMQATELYFVGTSFVLAVNKKYIYCIVKKKF